jgi:uncharacterized Zn-binding protein involved in type VI secretion
MHFALGKENLFQQPSRMKSLLAKILNPSLVSAGLILTLLGILAFWGTRLMAPKPVIAPVTTAQPGGENLDSSYARTLFGSAVAKPAADSTQTAARDSQIQVNGVMTVPGREGQLSVALLIVDGKPAKPYFPGETVVPGTIVKRVERDKVTIARSGTEVSLPAPTQTSTAILTAGKAAASMGNNHSNSGTLPAGSTNPAALPSSNQGAFGGSGSMGSAPTNSPGNLNNPTGSSVSSVNQPVTVNNGSSSQASGAISGTPAGSIQTPNSSFPATPAGGSARTAAPN